MPARPAQPAEVGGCVGPAVDQRQTQEAPKPGKKGAKKDARKKKTAQTGVTTEVSEKEERAWPSGISEQDEAPPAVPGAWPSGISEK